MNDTARSQVLVTVKPMGRVLRVRRGANLLDALARHEILVGSSCGGAGVCGKCRVRVISGRFLAAGEPGPVRPGKGFVLACRTAVDGSGTIDIPPSSIAGRAPGKETTPGFRAEIALDGALERRGFTPAPLTEKKHLLLPEPGGDSASADAERIAEALRQSGRELARPLPLEIIATLPHLLRRSRWRVTATLAGDAGERRMILLEAGNRADRNYAVAADIGTTTVSVSLVDPARRKILARETAFNSQCVHGEDIITRIVHAEREGGLSDLNRRVLKTVNDLIASVAGRCAVRPEEITAAVFAGNMTMMHLFFNVPPDYLRRPPHVPAASRFPETAAAAAGIGINPAGVVAAVGGAHPYVGGDITAGIIACGMNGKTSTNVLVDIGTNGEIVVGGRDWMLCCAASAGPAFEGSGARHGMRAVAGAIQGVVIEGDRVSLRTIGNAAPAGICGSGYVDIMAELFANRIISRGGVLETGGRRVRQNGAEKEFVLLGDPDAAGNGDIAVSQSDLENLLRAKAAVFAALVVVLGKAGVAWGEIEKIYIAGGFGNWLQVENAISIGLLPDIEREKFAFIGNASLAGAQLWLLSRDARRAAAETASRMTCLDLSRETGYMEEYMKALFLPHTDLALFPSQKTGREAGHAP